jgi:hypothetical protein
MGELERDQKMKYLVLRRLDGVSGQAGEPLALFMFDPEEGIAERFDRESGEWVDHPGMVEYSGYGGADPYFEITEGEAAEIMASWSGEEEDVEPE